MTEEHVPGQEPGVAGDHKSPRDPTSRAASPAPDPISVEPKGYPDIAESDGAREEESISGEEEDFLSE
jgi:hypothetical protein